MANDPKWANNLDPFRDTSADTEVGGQGRQQPQQPRQPPQPQQPPQPEQPRQPPQPEQPRQPPQAEQPGQQEQPGQREQPGQEEPDDRRPYYRPMDPEDVRRLHELLQMDPLPRELHPLRFALLLLTQDSPEDPYCDAQRTFIRNIPNWTT